MFEEDVAGGSDGIAAVARRVRNVDVDVVRGHCLFGDGIVHPSAWAGADAYSEAEHKHFYGGHWGDLRCDVRSKVVWIQFETWDRLCSVR